MPARRSYQSVIEKLGIGLESLGIKDIAFTRRDALLALEALQAEERLILGGDAYSRVGSQISSAYANWYVERRTGESEIELLRRSWESGNRFVIEYPVDGTIEPLFSFVVA